MIVTFNRLFHLGRSRYVAFALDSSCKYSIYRLLPSRGIRFLIDNVEYIRFRLPPHFPENPVGCPFNTIFHVVDGVLHAWLTYGSTSFLLSHCEQLFKIIFLAIDAWLTYGSTSFLLSQLFKIPF